MINNDRLGLFGANVYGDSITFRNFNFIGNRFYLYSTAETVPGRFQNCIFQGNTFVTPNYYALYPSLTFENCSVDYPDSSYFPPNVTCINTLFNQDPLFRDAANHDYTLLPCSPLINAGTNAAVVDIPTDITGAPRIQGGRVDIGAFEAPAFALATVPEVKPACTGTSNGSISIQPAFGCEPLEYQWSPPAGTGPELNGLPPGDYVYTVTDGKGRQITDTLTIPLAPAPDVSLQATDITCGLPVGGTITSSISSGAAPFHYQWLPIAPDTATLTQLPPGAYALTITDANGCLDSAAAQISLVGAITLQVSGQGISCFGLEDGWLAATPVTGASPFAWNWSGWPGTDSLAQPLGPGVYAVTVSDAYGCSASFAFPPMNQPDSLWATAAASPQTDPDVPNGGAAVTGVFGGMQPYNFEWNTGSTQQAIAGLAAGSYTVTVMDKNGCETAVEVTVQLIVGTDHPEQRAFLIYPNPAVDWVSVLLPESIRAGAIEVLDLSGRILLYAPIMGNPTSLNLQTLPSAQYLIRVQDEKGKVVFLGRVAKR
ncbi:MAG: T9SS type A sorting domain-containing protein [Saprospiraceae bacterium]|nr:T9SS type A sorting domain-containing protein [Saprospiraceae bacterium]